MIGRAGVEIALHVADEVVRRHDLDLHDRLEQHRLALRSASRIAIEPAILNDRSDESTSWYLPSIRRTWMSTTG